MKKIFKLMLLAVGSLALVTSCEAPEAGEEPNDDQKDPNGTSDVEYFVEKISMPFGGLTYTYDSEDRIETVTASFRADVDDEIVMNYYEYILDYSEANKISATYKLVGDADQKSEPAFEVKLNAQGYAESMTSFKEGEESLGGSTDSDGNVSPNHTYYYDLKHNFEYDSDGHLTTLKYAYYDSKTGDLSDSFGSEKLVYNWKDGDIVSVVVDGKTETAEYDEQVAMPQNTNFELSALIAYVSFADMSAMNFYMVDTNIFGVRPKSIMTGVFSTTLNSLGLVERLAQGLDGATIKYVGVDLENGVSDGGGVTDSTL